MGKLTIYKDLYFWSNEEIKDSIRELREVYEEYEDYSDDDMYSVLEYDNLDDICNVEAVLDSIDKNIPGIIIGIADLGLWYGRRYGCKQYNCLTDILYTDCEYNNLYVDEYGNLKQTSIHHDGTNCYEYRMTRPDLTYDQEEYFLIKTSCGEITENDIKKYTVRLGDYVSEYFGYEKNIFKGRRPSCIR